MKSVLITGAYGFLGRNVAKVFKKQGDYVAGIGHGKWDSDEFTQWGIDDWYETTITFEALLNIKDKFDIIVHCGGSGSVGYSWENPYQDFQRSVQSTLSILEYIRLQNVGCKFIYPSSPAVQGNLGYVQIEESMISIPVSPYGFHKKIAEEICLSYHNNFKIDIGIIRYFSIYGDGLQKQLLWDACKKIQNSDDAIFFGTGNETRDWIHVADAASLMYVFSEQVKGFQVVNGGTGEGVTISKVLDQVRDYFNMSKEINFNGYVKEGDPLHFWADITKALALGWVPKIKLEEGLKSYVNYFKETYHD
jgi:UDP-glucose 4-epimerase